MKKKLILLAMCLIFLVFCLIVCILPTLEVYISGIENFSPFDSTLSLSQNLFPSEDFLDRFAYTEGDYHYYFNGKLMGGYATSFSLLRYAPGTYESAKEYCVQHFAITDEHQYTIGNYTFIEHLSYTSANKEGKYVLTCQYPQLFNMFAYDDSSKTLLFLGYYNSNLDSPSTQIALTDFEAFFNEHFGKYYVLN